MNGKWKDIFVGVTLLIVLILATNTLIEYLLVKTLKMNSGVIVGFIGAILGGTLSGVITLKGVRITIENQKNSEIERQLPKQISALYITIQDISQMNYLVFNTFEEIEITGYESSCYDIEINDLLTKMDNKIEIIILRHFEVGINPEKTIFLIHDKVSKLLQFQYNLVDLDEDPEGWNYYELYSESYIDDIKNELLDSLKESENKCFKMYNELKKSL